MRFRLEGQLQPDGSRYKVPQMGWNQVHAGARRTRSGPACPTAAYFYFVHSYYARPSDAAPQRRARPTTARRFTCALARDNIFATQFHPEKSAEHGLALYRNFLHWNP